MKHVPFEGLPEKEALDPKLEASTITPSEKKAFESLLAIRSNGSNSAAIAGELTDEEAAILEPFEEDDYETDAPKLGDYETGAQTLDGILETALEKVEKSRRAQSGEVSLEKPKLTNDYIRSKTVQRNRRRLKMVEATEQNKKDFRVVKYQMKARGNTDADVWYIFQEKVVDVLVRMMATGKGEKSMSDRSESDVDEKKPGSAHDANSIPDASDATRPVATANGRQADSTAERDDKSMVLNPHRARSPVSSQSHPDPADLASLLSAYTLLAQVILSTRYAGSPFALSVVPRILSLGPFASAFVLDVSHYNKHLGDLWRQNQDLVAMLDMLKFMDDNVVTFNETTWRVTKDATNFADRAAAEFFGPSLKVLWTMDAKMHDVSKMKAWSRKILQRRQEEELGRVQMEDAIREGVVPENRLSFDPVPLKPQLPTHEVFPESIGWRSVDVADDAEGVKDVKAQEDAVAEDRLRFTPRPPDPQRPSHGVFQEKKSRVDVDWRKVDVMGDVESLKDLEAREEI